MSIIPWYSDQTCEVLMAYARGAGAVNAKVAFAAVIKAVNSTGSFASACEYIDKIFKQREETR